VKDTMPQLHKSNDTFGESEEGSMMSSLMSKLGLNEPSLNSNNIQTLEGTTNNLPFQMGDGSATAQGEPFVPDGSNNAFTGITPPKLLTLSDKEYKDYDFEYGPGAGFYIKQLIKYFNDPSNNHGIDLENVSYDDFFEGDEFDNIIDQINNETFKNATFDSPEAEQFFDAVFGSGTLNTIKKMIKSNPKLENMNFEDLVDLIRSKSNSKYGFIDDIVDDMVDNSTGKYNFIDNIVNDMFDSVTDEYDYNLKFPFPGEPDEAGGKDIEFDIDFLKVFHASFGDKNHILATMSAQKLSEYQMLSEEYSQVSNEILNRNKITFSGSNLTGNRFQNPNAKPRELVFDDDFKKMFFADEDLLSESVKNMTYEKYNEYSDMRREYQNLDYEEKINDMSIFEGDKLIGNRFLAQNDPNEFEKELEKYRLINMPPPEQSIAVRGRGRPVGSKNKPKISVDIPPKPKTLGDVVLRSMMENIGAATKPPKGAAKGTKSPLLKRIKDLE